VLRSLQCLTRAQVFDVTRGARHYGPGGGYAGFAGRDGTRAFVSGVFTEDGLIEEVAGLSDVDAAGLLTWRDFYHKDYTFLGLLAGGAFYDERGRGLPPLAALAEGAARAAAAREAAEAAARAAPACSAAWSAAQGGEVWCDEAGYAPRRAVAAPVAALGETQPSVRCACVRLAEQDAVAIAAAATMETYPGCEANSQRCRTSPPKAAAGG